MEDFDRDGYLIVRGLFSREEAAILCRVAKSDAEIQEKSYPHRDSQGRTSELVLWNHHGDTAYGAVAHSPRIVDTMERLLGAEVYHWHTKLSMKKPLTGGEWAWHQDYGYWYDSCLYPDMASAFVAIDPNTRENGCMQVLRGSHKLGRFDHGRYNGVAGAEPERVAEAVKRLETVYCELEPGDVLFFHASTLHRSDPNQSPDPRWSLICCYNTRHNSPYKASPHPSYGKLERASDSRLREFA